MNLVYFNGIDQTRVSPLPTHVTKEIFYCIDLILSISSLKSVFTHLDPCGRLIYNFSDVSDDDAHLSSYMCVQGSNHDRDIYSGDRHMGGRTNPQSWGLTH